jgi:VWFA-related protein
VAIDVIATDKHGNPVTDLTAQDFEISQDSKPQTVKLFHFVTKATPVRLPERSDLQLGPNAVTNIPETQWQKPVNIILLDLQNSTVSSQARAKQVAKAALKAAPLDEVFALYVITRGRMYLAMDVTADRSAMINSIDKQQLELPSGSAALANSIPLDETASMQSLAQQRQTDDNLQAISGGYLPSCFQQEKALRTLANRLRGIPGRKKLIWLSDSFAYNPLSSSSACGVDSGRTNELFTISQIAIYPIDTKGLTTVASRPTSSFAASSTTAAYAGDINTGGFPASSNAPAGFPMPRTPFVNLRPTESQTGGKIPYNSFSNNAQGAYAQQWLSILQRADNTRLELSAIASDTTAVREIADATGGKGYVNTNNLEGAIRDSFADGNTYYTLGFYPGKGESPNPMHHLNIKVKRPDVTLRYRTNYILRDFEKLNERERAQDLGLALDLNSPNSTELMFAAEPKQDGASVNIKFAVDAKKLRFDVDKEGKQAARVDFVLMVYDKDGTVIKSAYKTIESSLGEDSYHRVLENGFPGDLTIALLPGQYSARMGVRDSRTGALGTANATFTVK